MLIKIRRKNKNKEKDKAIKLLFVLDRENPFMDEQKQVPNVLCVVKNKKQAEEYIDRLLFTKRFEHYSAWCSLKHLQINDESWAHYKSLTTNPYYYRKTPVNYSTISSLLRIFYGCQPIGCSFDTLVETSAFLAKMQMQEEQEEDIEDIFPDVPLTDNKA